MRLSAERRNELRTRIWECARDFATDDEFPEERRQILEALEDPLFPRSEEGYDGFCMGVLCWIPGKQEP